MATFIEGRQWSLVTPLEWALSDFEIKFTEGPERRTDSQIEELIEKNWEKRQAERKQKGIFMEDPWPKTGYRGHTLDLAGRVLTLHVSPANWKAMQGTHFNPEFFELMLKRYNGQSRTKLSSGNMHRNPNFQEFIRPYLDGALGQCAAIKTAAGFPIGFRSDEVGVADNIWHVPGGYLPGIGEGIYKSEVPLIDGKPIVYKERFTPDVESMKQNAIVNYYKESGRRLNPLGAIVHYTGMMYELPNHSMVILSVVDSTLDAFGTNWEHDSMRHFRTSELPKLLGSPQEVLGGKILMGGEAALALAYSRENGLDGISDFSAVKQSPLHE